MNSYDFLWLSLLKKIWYYEKVQLPCGLVYHQICYNDFELMLPITVKNLSKRNNNTYKELWEREWKEHVSLKRCNSNLRNPTQIVFIGDSYFILDNYSPIRAVFWQFFSHSCCSCDNWELGLMICLITS